MYVKQLSNPPKAVTTVIGPVIARRRRVGYPLGAIQPARFLRRYPNGSKLSTLQGFQDAPQLTQFINGQPLSVIDNGAGGAIPKAQLVIVALNRAMRRKRRGRGMGDDGQDDSELMSNTGADAGEGTLYTVDGSTEEPVYSSGTVPASGGAWSESPAGGLSTNPTGPTSSAPSTAGNALTNLLNSLLRPSGSTIPVYSSVGSGLSSPIYAGSSLSTGGVLVIGGVLLVAVMAFSGKRRR